MGCLPSQALLVPVSCRLVHAASRLLLVSSGALLRLAWRLGVQSSSGLCSTAAAACSHIYILAWTRLGHVWAGVA